MMPMRVLFVASLAVITGQTEFHDEADYRADMREIDHAFTKLTESEPVKRGAELEREAKRLSDLFQDVEDFWIARGDEEAANFARMAKDGAKRAGKAVREGDEHSFDAALRIVAASCEGCHQEPLDKYRVPLPK